MTPTQFIRQVALKTGKAKAPRKIIEYRDFEYEDVEDEYCWLCGGKTEGKGRPIKKAIKGTFLDQPYARKKDSKSICKGCAFCLDSKNSSLRNYSILATEKGLQHPGRNEWRQILFNPPDPPFLAILSVSGQKHLHFKGGIAQDTNYYPILLEEMSVVIDKKKLSHITWLVEVLYSNGFSKTEIQEGKYKQHRIMEFGISRWEELEDKLKPYRPSGLMEVALYIAQEQENLVFEKKKEVYKTKKEDEGECITISKQKKEIKQLRLF